MGARLSAATLPSMVDYLRRTEAMLRRARKDAAARATAEARAQAEHARAARPTRPRGRPPTPGGPAGYIRPRDLRARAERAASYLPLAPTFAHLINLGEPGCGVEHARRMVARIVTLSDRGGWTSSEYNMLWAAKKRWQRRADGKDARYLIVGNRRGRLSRAEQQQVAARQAALDIGAIAEQVTEDAQRAGVGIGYIE